MTTFIYGAPDGEGSHPIVLYDIGMEMGPAAAYVQLVQPAFALGVAAWLESEATSSAIAARVLCSPSTVSPWPSQHALAVARQVLGIAP